MGGSIGVEGYVPKDEEDPGSSRHWSLPGFFRTVGIPLIAGRDFSDADRDGAPRVGIVNQEFVRQFVPDGRPLGKRFSFSRNGDRDIEIVGVVGSTKHQSLTDKPHPAAYVPYTQEENTPPLKFYVRASGDLSAVAAGIRATVSSFDPNVPLYNMEPLTEALERTVASERLMTLLTASFGGLAVLLAAVGIYGVIAWTVARRTNEIAVRVALGAEPGSVLRLVLREVTSVAAAGVLVGAVVALGAGRLLESHLFGLTPRDPLIFLAAVIIAMAVAGFAAAVPAWRATRIDPALSLRFE